MKPIPPAARARPERMQRQGFCPEQGKNPGMGWWLSGRLRQTPLQGGVDVRPLAAIDPNGRARKMGMEIARDCRIRLCRARIGGMDGNGKHRRQRAMSQATPAKSEAVPGLEVARSVLGFDKVWFTRHALQRRDSGRSRSHKYRRPGAPAKMVSGRSQAGTVATTSRRRCCERWNDKPELLPGCV